MGWWTLPYQFRKRFYFVRQIGRGGMGAVFLAVDDDASGPDRRVAVKVAQANPRTRHMLKLLFRLERAQAGVLAEKYPQFFVGVRGWDNTDPAYLALEYLDPRERWQTLRDFVSLYHHGSDRTVDPVCVAEIGVALLRGVEAMARSGVVHRDLKPDNIFLRSTGGGYDVKIGDLGLACDEKMSGMGFDAEGSVRSIAVGPPGAGTAEYKSPEQQRGEKLTCQSDIHTVGSILWEAAAGTVPYPEGPDRLGRMRSAPARPPAMPEKLFTILARALDHDPNSRWKNEDPSRLAARDMREDLKSLVSASSNRSGTVALLRLSAALRPWVDLDRDVCLALETASVTPELSQQSARALQARLAELLGAARLAEQATAIPSRAGNAEEGQPSGQRGGDVDRAASEDPGSYRKLEARDVDVARWDGGEAERIERHRVDGAVRGARVPAEARVRKRAGAGRVDAPSDSDGSEEIEATSSSSLRAVTAFVCAFLILAGLVGTLAVFTLRACFS